MVVREFFASLGLAVDEQSVAVGVAAVDAIKKGLEVLGGIVRDTARDFVDSIISTAEYGDSLDELADRTGLSTDALQKLAYGASFSGVSIDELAQSLNYLAKNGAKDVYAATAAVADQVKALVDAGRKGEAVDLAIEKLGKSGARLIPFLKQGRAGLKAFADEAERTGMVMSPEEIQRSVEFADNMQRLGYAFEGVRREIGSAFFEPLIAGMQWVTVQVRSLRKWLSSLKKEIDDDGKVVKAFRFALAALAAYGFIRTIASAISWLKYLYLMRASIIQTIALHWNQVRALLATAAAEWTTVLATLALWAAFALGFVLLALLLEDIYVFATGGESAIGEFIEWLKEKGWPLIKQGFWKLLDWYLETTKSIMSMVGDAFLAALMWPIDKAKEAFGAFLQWYLESTGKLLSFLPGGERLAKGLGLVGEGGAPSAASQFVNSLFGGGASPTASAGAVPAQQAYVLSPQFRANFTVNAGPGQNPEEVANQTQNTLDKWWDTKMYESWTAVGQ